MDAIAILIERFTSSLLTEVICIVCVLAALVGFVALALIVEACDTIPDRRYNRKGDVSNKERRLHLI